jgi:hypothetical protein
MSNAISKNDARKLLRLPDWGEATIDVDGKPVRVIRFPADEVSDTEWKFSPHWRWGEYDRDSFTLSRHDLQSIP